MPYAQRAPSVVLEPYVEAYWWMDAPAAGAEHRVLPDGCMDILFDGASGARVVGSMTRALVTAPPATGAPLLGVRFHPGQAAPLLRLDARDLRDATAALDEVWGRAGRALSDEVGAAPTREGKVRAIERALHARLAAAKKGDDLAGERVRAAVRQLRGASGAVGIGGLARGLGVSERTLERLFDERVGVGPKLLARIFRLQSVVATLDRSPAPSWSAVAADLSFADQAHLVREVAALGGTTPSRLLQERLHLRRMSDSFKTAPAPAPTVPPALVTPARAQEIRE